MEENSNTTKSFRQECEEDIKYIQSHLISDFKFDLLPFEISPDEQRSYYSQLHGLLFAYISTYKLNEFFKQSRNISIFVCSLTELVNLLIS